MKSQKMTTMNTTQIISELARVDGEFERACRSLGRSIEAYCIKEELESRKSITSPSRSSFKINKIRRK